MARIKVEDWISPGRLSQIEQWARDGLTDKQIAKNIGIGYSTLSEWRARKPEITEALKRGKVPLVQELEDALYKRAKGFYVTEERVEAKVLRYENGKDGKPRAIPDTKGAKVIQIKRYVPPDVTALIFSLKNLVPVKWRDRREYIDTSETGGEISADVRNAVEQAVQSYGDADTDAQGKEAGETGDDS